MNTNTIIELFDEEEPIHNLVSALANKPQKLIFMGNTSKFDRSCPLIKQFLANAGNSEIEISFRPVPERNLLQIADALQQLVQENPDCSIDLTGGKELFAAAAGIVFERCRAQGVQLHQYNIRTERVYDCDGDGQIPVASFPGIRVSQQIMIHGGTITECFFDSDDLNIDSMTRIKETVDKLWHIAAKNPEKWNRFIGNLNRSRIEKTTEGITALQITDNSTLKTITEMFAELRRIGLVSEYTENHGKITFRYAEQFAENMMNKAGNILEAKVFLCAIDAKNENEKPVYQSAASGVMIKWDRKSESDCYATVNELDGIFMHGAVPVCASCKNGKVDMEELYKLAEVTRRFGGKYAKSVLICSDISEIAPAFFTRAADMNIRVFADVKDWKDVDFTSALTNLLK